MPGSTEESRPGDVRMQWGVKIPLRDGVHLNATLYLPKEPIGPAPAVFTLTPYISETYHDYAFYFAAHGYPFLAIDVRGRGNSDGAFRPFIDEANNGFDIVEWLAAQPFCDGRVAMWGGSYAGVNQWATARECPAHLATIVPVASPFYGVDVPIRGNITTPYWMQWLTYVWGRAAQNGIFHDPRFWAESFRAFFESGRPLRELDTFLGMPSRTFQEWLDHPHRDEYWDGYNPTSEQYARIDIPVLTITGSYDADQPGALEHYRRYMKHASPAARGRHYLVIGPWDHFGTRTPQAQFAGMNCGPASLIDLKKLHLEWYDWTMRSGQKPTFLQEPVAYYVTEAEKWRYAETLDAITAEHKALYLDSRGSACSVFASGLLSEEAGSGDPDVYVYDPRDVSFAAYEAETAHPLSILAENMTDQTHVFACEGRQLVYHSAPFERDTEFSGFFKLIAWLSIDQPDTDFRVAVYEIGRNGDSVLLTYDMRRARYRESLREEKLIETGEPLQYVFDGFTFISRLIRRGSRLRLTLGPVNSIYIQKNYNSGGCVSDETMKDARSVTVKLFHDAQRPSALYAPLGQPE